MFHVKQKRVAFWCPAGACLLCCLPTLPFVCLSAPSPRPPSPRGEGGDFWFSYARGSAPCIPGAEPAQHWLNRGAGAPGTPAAKPGRHWLFLPRQCFFIPIPPAPPSPVGKGEIFGFLMQGAPPLASPGLNPRGAGSIGGLAPPAPLLQKPRGAGYAFGT